MIAARAVLVALIAALPATAAAEDVRPQAIRVIDGDTIALACAPAPCRGERIRLEAIDAPESWRSRCAAEADLAARATRRLVELLAAGPATITRHGHDRSGRTLATLTVAGRDVGATLVAEGLALPWKPGRAAWADRLKTWCGINEKGGEHE